MVSPKVIFGARHIFWCWWNGCCNAAQWHFERLLLLVALKSKDIRERVDENIVHRLFDSAVSTLVICVDNKPLSWNRVKWEGLSQVMLTWNNMVELDICVVVLFGIKIVRDWARTRRRLMRRPPLLQPGDPWPWPGTEEDQRKLVTCWAHNRLIQSGKRLETIRNLKFHCNGALQKGRLLH